MQASASSEHGYGESSGPDRDASSMHRIFHTSLKSKHRLLAEAAASQKRARGAERIHPKRPGSVP